jgi:cytochrome P450
LISFPSVTHPRTLDGHLCHAFLWGLGILATHPEVQQKCVEAIARREQIGDHSDIDKDKEDYMMAFVKELFRYAAPFRLSLPRETIGKDCVWEGNVIPAGTTVISNVHAMNRDEERFAKTEEFIPERFMKGPNAERSIAHYSFGQGRR